MLGELPHGAIPEFRNGTLQRAKELSNRVLDDPVAAAFEYVRGNPGGERWHRPDRLFLPEKRSRVADKAYNPIVFVRPPIRCGSAV